MQLIKKVICTHMQKLKSKASLFALALIAVAGYVVSANGVHAEVPTASSTLDSIMTVIVSTTVSLATTIFTTYWPYLLVFGIISGLVAAFSRFLKIGGKK